MAPRSPTIKKQFMLFTTSVSQIDLKHRWNAGCITHPPSPCNLKYIGLGDFQSTFLPLKFYDLV